MGQHRISKMGAHSYSASLRANQGLMVGASVIHNMKESNLVELLEENQHEMDDGDVQMQSKK